MHFPTQMQQSCLGGWVASLKFWSFLYPLKPAYDGFSVKMYLHKAGHPFCWRLQLGSSHSGLIIQLKPDLPSLELDYLDLDEDAVNHLNDSTSCLLILRCSHVIRGKIYAVYLNTEAPDEDPYYIAPKMSFI